MEVSRFTSLYVSDEEFNEYDCVPKGPFLTPWLVFLFTNHTNK